MSRLEIRTIAVLSDNYVHVIRDSESGAVICVDPADDAKIRQDLKRWQWDVTHILITHPHFDHVDGIASLLDVFDAEVYASRDDLKVVPYARHGVMDGDELQLGSMAVTVMGLPGHTAHHVGYYFKKAGAVFSGDTLFSLGCGRLLGGKADQLWASLQKLRALPRETLIYGTHEYTQDNARFAMSLDSDNQDLKNRVQEVQELRAKGLSTIPSSLAEEIKCNPFLRCDVIDFQKTLGLYGQDGAQVFAELRRQKDQF